MSASQVELCIQSDANRCFMILNTTVHPIYSEVQALRFPGHQMSWVSDWVCDFSPWATSAMEATKKQNLAQRYPMGWGWCPNVEYTHSAEKACDTTLNDE